MCEILLRVADIIHPDPIVNRQAPKAGDVIDIRDDGWPWTDLDINTPGRKLLRLPGVDKTIFEDMLRAAYDGNGNILYKKARNFNLTAPWFAAKLNAGVDITLLVPTERALSDVVALKVTK